MPCADISAAEHEKNANMEIGHSDADHEDCEDFCTPFCSCSCCGTTMAFFYPERISLVRTISCETVNATFIPNAFSNFNHSIWLPPKI